MLLTTDSDADNSADAITKHLELNTGLCPLQHYLISSSEQLCGVGTSIIPIFR